MDPWLTNAVDDENISNNSKSSLGFDDNFKPFLKMNDSGSYISTLESRLARIRGDNKQPTSRDMVEDAGRRKDDHLSNFLHGLEVSWSAWSDDGVAEESTNETSLQTMLKLKFHPEKCALRMEELQSLIKADQLNSNEQNLTQSSDQNNDLNSQEDTKPS